MVKYIIYIYILCQEKTINHLYLDFYLMVLFICLEIVIYQYKVGKTFLQRFNLSKSLLNFYDDICVFKATAEFNQTSYL